MLKNFSGNLNKYKEFEDIRIGVSEGFGSVAFDWLSENLYWTDSMHDWIAMQPAYTKDESMFKIIVSDGLRQPEGLAIDPLARYIFWSDVHHDTIERTSLSGNERKILAFKSLKRVYSMVADVDKQMLFWVDEIRGTLETCDYNGQNRRVIDRKKGSHPTSVDISMVCKQGMGLIKTPFKKDTSIKIFSSFTVQTQTYKISFTS
ncbi:hypothetical protein FSP39_022421 [Pinctada imbricata]|uniref:Uncharacterized protein n=1 Tax=Pinctada imbricata TaxID=66713 RepID=A0AA89BIB8_PINIB|nr:hypothetical protein FSP39_022421 [Pinctada imbricata]